MKRAAGSLYLLLPRLSLMNRCGRRINHRQRKGKEHKIMYRTLLLLLVTYLSSTMSSAWSAIDSAFAKVLKDPQEQAMIVDTAKRSNVVIEDSCKDPFVRVGDQVRIRGTPK